MPVVSDEEFITAIAALHGADDADDLCAPFLAALPITGVAISTLGEPFGSETVCATDPAAARLDEIQIDLGEGPCWDAVRTGRPVLEPDVRASTSDRYPVALLAMQDAGIGAVFAFPLRVGSIDVGAVDLYDRDPATLADADVQDAIALSDAVARQVLHRALARHDDSGEQDVVVSHYSRREVYQASGMLAAQAGVGAADALLLLRAHAYARGRTVRGLADEVLARTVDFADPDDPAQ